MSTTTRQRRRILLVDDELHQRDTVAHGLRLQGYRCLPTRSAAEALAVLEREGSEAFDLLLTDLTMPGCSGAELIAQSLERWPELAIVAITGAAETAAAECARAYGIVVLEKPFDPDDLDRALTRVLEGGREGPARG